MRSRVLLLLIGMLIGLLLGCGPSVPMPSGVQPVRLPDLTKLDPAAQREIAQCNQRIKSFQLKRDEKNYRRLAGEHGNLGMRLLAYHLYEPAETCFKNAETIDPTDFTWPYCLGHVHRQSDAAEKAIAAFKRAVNMLSSAGQRRRFSEPAHCWIGDLYLQLDQADEAELHFVTALEADSQSTFARFGLAQVARRRGDTQRAFAEYRRVLQNFPDAKNVHYALMIMYRKSGDRAAAERHKRLFEESSQQLTVRDMLLTKIDLLDTSSRASRRRGYEALFVTHNYIDAVRHYRHALQGEPDDPVLHHNLATALARSGQPKAAMKEYLEAIRLKPDSASSHSNLGAMYRVHRDIANSLKHLRAAHKYDPDDVITTFELALTLMRDERFEEAVKWFDEVLKVEPAHAEALRERAKAYLLDRKYLLSRDRLLEALKVIPDDGPIQRQLVELLAACPQSDVRDAKHALEIAKSISPVNYPGIRAESLAMAYAESGDFEQAKVWSDRALKIARQRSNQERIKHMEQINEQFLEKKKPVRFPEYVRRRK